MAFKEICPAGPGYHYSASALQFNQRVTEQLGGRGALAVLQENPGQYCRRNTLCSHISTLHSSLCHLFSQALFLCRGLSRTLPLAEPEPLRLQFQALAPGRPVQAVPRPDPVRINLARPPALRAPGLCSPAVLAPGPRLLGDPGPSRTGPIPPAVKVTATVHVDLLEPEQLKASHDLLIQAAGRPLSHRPERTSSLLRSRHRDLGVTPQWARHPGPESRVRDSSTRRI